MKPITQHGTFAVILIAASTLTVAACVSDTTDSHDDHLGQETAQLSDAEVVAACASKAHKQAVCHIPPGNPANAHTICISSNAVQKHLDLHGDYLGACEGGDGGSDGSGGSTTSSSSTSGSGGGGTCGGELTPCSSDSDCIAGIESCVDGCCWPYVD